MKKKAKYITAGAVVSLIILVLVFVFYFKAIYGDRTLIVYFSRAGNTEFSNDVDAVTSASLRREQSGKLTGNCEVLANDIHGLTGAEVHEIQIRDVYPEDYDATVDRASQEKNQNVRPELVGHVNNMEDYDNIILIYPVWWSTVPMPVFTFLEEYDFAGKTILPITTHKGSFLGNSVSDLRQALPEANVKNGIAISGSSVDFLKYWIVGVFVGMVLLVLSVGMAKKHKQNPAKSKIWTCLTVVGLVIIVLCVIKLLV